MNIYQSSTGILLHSDQLHVTRVFKRKTKWVLTTQLSTPQLKSPCIVGVDYAHILIKTIATDPGLSAHELEKYITQNSQTFFHAPNAELYWDYFKASMPNADSSINCHLVAAKREEIIQRKKSCQQRGLRTRAIIPEFLGLINLVYWNNSLSKENHYLIVVNQFDRLRFIVFGPTEMFVREEVLSLEMDRRSVLNRLWQMIFSKIPHIKQCIVINPSNDNTNFLAHLSHTLPIPTVSCKLKKGKMATESIENFICLGLALEAFH